MKFTYWKKDTLERIYVNGIADFEGKCFLQRKGEKITISTYGGKLTSKQMEDIYTIIEDRYGMAKEDITFDALLHAINKPKPPKKVNLKGFRGKNNSVEDRALSTEALDILSIHIPEKVQVRLDHREPKELAEILSSHPDIEITVEALDLGDIIINDTIIIERKDCTYETHATDFENSVIEKDKRLFNQSERLKLQDDYIPIILLEGSCYDNSQRMLVQQIDGAISFLAVIQKISVWTTYNLNHTAYMIAKLARHHKSGLGYEVALRAKKPEKLLNKKSFVLEGITGVSAKIAKDLLAHFGSVQNVVNATEEELLKVKGLGKAKIANMVEVLK